MNWTEFAKGNALIIVYVLVTLFIIFLMWLLRRINRGIFKKIKKKHTEIHFRFLERLISGTIIVGGIVMILSLFDGFNSMWKTLLGGTAIVSAVVAFAAQDAIKDILGGLMISIYRPFEIGNRIVLEDGTAGIVKDITMRHVVLQGIDSQMMVIPNSKLNGMNLTNFSYHSVFKSAQLSFHIAYGSDVELAMQVIKDVLKASEYSVPGVKKGDEIEYAGVYFMAYEDSSLRLTTTVFYEASSPSEVVISDINLRVNKAFNEHGIEIPFQYINVINK